MISHFVKRLLLIINVFAVAFLLLGLLAGHVSTVHFRVLIFFSFAFPFFAIANLFFVGFWMLFKKLYFIPSLLTLLICYQPLNATFNILPEDAPPKPEKSFTVLSHNVKVFDLYNWSHNKKSRNEYFKYLRKIKPEIACFQEYFNTKGNDFPIHDSLIKSQRFKYSHISYSVQLPNGHNFGIATYSRFPIVHKKNISFGKTHNMAIATDIKVFNDTIRVINCHLQSVRFLSKDYLFIDKLPGLSDEDRIDGAKGVLKRLSVASKIRARQAQLIANEIKTSPYPVMVCGDFNDVPTSYVYHQLSRELEDSYHNEGFGINGTYPRFFVPFRIDYILFDEHIRCHGFRTETSKLSDHFAIIGEYSMNE